VLHVNQLIIIGGPSCAGKSTLIDKIRDGTFPDLSENIGITFPSSWSYAKANDFMELHEQVIERLVIHFDFYRQYQQKNEFNYLPELVNNSNSVIILTLDVSPEILIKRVESRIYGTLKSLLGLGMNKRISCLHFWRRTKLLLKKRKAYKEGHSMFLYEKWFLFYSQNKVKAHWILDSNDNICELSRSVHERI